MLCGLQLEKKEKTFRSRYISRDSHFLRLKKLKPAAGVCEDLPYVSWCCHIARVSEVLRLTTVGKARMQLDRHQVIQMQGEVMIGGVIFTAVWRIFFSNLCSMIRLAENFSSNSIFPNGESSSRMTFIGHVIKPKNHSLPLVITKNVNFSTASSTRTRENCSIIPFVVVDESQSRMFLQELCTERWMGTGALRKKD